MLDYSRIIITYSKSVSNNVLDIKCVDYRVQYLETKFSEDMKYLWIYIGSDRHLIINTDNVLSMEFME